MAGYGCGSAVTEQEAREIEKEHTTQSTSRAEQKRSVSLSKVCEVITCGYERDEVRYHLFHYLQWKASTPELTTTHKHDELGASQLVSSTPELTNSRHNDKDIPDELAETQYENKGTIEKH